MADKKPWIPDYIIKDARIMWRNFGGRQERFNAKGSRNFTIFLRPEDSERLTEMGLNVKTLPPREEGEQPQDILKVKVNFDTGRPPRLVMVTHRGRTQLGPDEAQLLDFAQIQKVDLILSPYYWDVEGKEGIAVSVKSLFMTIVEDELEIEYGDIPEASSAARSFEYTPADDED
jgi:hypothetical protein